MSYKTQHKSILPTQSPYNTDPKLLNATQHVCTLSRPQYFQQKRETVRNCCTKYGGNKEGHSILYTWNLKLYNVDCTLLTCKCTLYTSDLTVHIRPFSTMPIPAYFSPPWRTRRTWRCSAPAAWPATGAAT